MEQRVVWLPLAQIRPSPKNFFRPPGEEEIRELAESISRHGVMDPIGVRQVGEGKYEVISGHSRLKAIASLGWKEAPCLVFQADDVEAELMLIDANLQSRNLSPMEIARAIRRKKELLGERRGRPEKGPHNEDKLSGKYGEVFAGEFGMSRAQVERYDKLNDLIPEFQELVDRGKLGPTAGEQLARLDPEVQRQLYDALGEEVIHLKVAEIKRLREEQDRGFAVVLALQQRIDQLEAELSEFRAKHGSREELQREIERLRQKKKLLEYDLADRRQALKRLERQAKPGAALLDLMDRIGRPVQAALTDLALLAEKEYDEYTVRVAQKWALVFERAAACLRAVAEGRAVAEEK
ncbi:MAG: ParB N-terminal domain-containing protein [Moorellales bacterium]